MGKESRNRKDSLSSEDGCLQEDSLSGSPRNKANNKQKRNRYLKKERDKLNKQKALFGVRT